ncbi:MAG: hypothetical protein K9K37_10595 [Desulfocapsa sp.]|nr:hypothetical protein [Desulfocapsa sp.]
MKIFHPFINNLNIISLGWGCASRTELIRRYFPEHPVLFFDYLGNFDGLDTCTQIILNDFQDFQTIDDLFFYQHPGWNTDIELKPISLCCNPPGISQTVLVSKHFVDLVFYHYKHNIDTLQSFKRKSERFKRMMQDTRRQTIFLYYRQFDIPLDGNYAENENYSIDEKLSRLESESIRFREAIEKKYPLLQFKLIALIMEPITFDEKVTPVINEFFQQKQKATRKIIFDRVLASTPEDKRKISSKSWGKIYRKHLIPNPVLRFSRACLNIPFKVRRNVQQLRKKLKLSNN